MPGGGCTPRVTAKTTRRRWILVAVAAVAVVVAMRVTVFACDEFAHLQLIDELSLAVNPNDDVSTREALERTARQFGDAAGAAPAEIQPDVQLLADLTAALSDAIADTDSRETFDRAAALISAQDPYLETQDAVAQRVVDYVTRHCIAAPG